MSAYARSFVEAVWKIARPKGRVLEIGSRCLYSSMRDLHDDWWGIDVIDGLGVDEIADGADYRCDPVDLILAVEVFEHAERWREIIANAETLLKPGGYLIATMAGPGCPAHSIDGGPLEENEYFATVDPCDLAISLQLFHRWSIDMIGHDLRCWGRKRL